MYLLPCLCMGLLSADIRETTLACWDDRIRRAVLDGAGMTMGRTLPATVYHTVPGVPRLTDHRRGLLANELMVMKNAQYPCSRTHRARAAAMQASKTKTMRRLHRTAIAPWKVRKHYMYAGPGSQ